MRIKKRYTGLWREFQHLRVARNPDRWAARAMAAEPARKSRRLIALCSFLPSEQRYD
jgi:hypothetical protein